MLYMLTRDIHLVVVICFVVVPLFGPCTTQSFLVDKHIPPKSSLVGKMNGRFRMTAVQGVRARARARVEEGKKQTTTSAVEFAIFVPERCGMLVLRALSLIASMNWTCILIHKHSHA